MQIKCFNTFLQHRFGIELAGISSDGDTRLLSAMKYEISRPDGILAIQDTIHLGGKLRNKILNSDMPIGKHIVSIDHLKSLVTKVHKSVHGLTQNDICPEDRMDFDSFLKITKDRVLTALQQHIEDSNGTIQYLKMCKYITSSFLDLDVEPLERIFRMYRAVFFLRIWRQTIISSKSYKLRNFITSNAYACVEINARNLIAILKKFRDQNHPELFLPPIFDSQTCEKAFRVFRSMGTTQFTKINFSLLELIHMIGRVETQHDIAYFKLKETPIKFPHMRTDKTKIYKLPTDEEIIEIIAKAKQEALKDAELLEMSCPNSKDIDEYHFEAPKIFSDILCSDDENSDEEGMKEDEWNDGDMNDGITGRTNEEICSSYVVILDESGVERVVRKSTYLWMLTEQYEKLSNDRIKRFQKKEKMEEGNKKIRSKKRKLD